MLACGLLDRKSSHDEAGVDADVDADGSFGSPGGVTRTGNDQLLQWIMRAGVPDSALPPGMLPWTRQSIGANPAPACGLGSPSKNPANISLGLVCCGCCAVCDRGGYIIGEDRCCCW
jgi:hypothetical protein